MSVPQIEADVDRERVKSYGVALTDVFETLQVYLGSLYVNDFNRFGRTYQVNAQAESAFRLQPEQIRRLETRNAHGDDGAARIARDRVAQLRARSGDALQRLSRPPRSTAVRRRASARARRRRRSPTCCAQQLPPGMTFEWTELAYQELLAGNTMLLVFPLCVLLVYVVLAAQYESWTLPLTVILIVPMTLFSAIAGVWLTGGDNNVFTQISFLVLAGLACKNAILIVEFAKQREEEGRVARCDAILDGVPHPAAPDSDDVDGVHHGRRAAGLLVGRGLRDSSGDGHRGVRRDARRHAVRPVPHAGVLHRHRPADAIAPRARSGGAASCRSRRRRKGIDHDVASSVVGDARSARLGGRVRACGRRTSRPTVAAGGAEQRRHRRWSSSSRSIRGGGSSSRIRCSTSSSTRALGRQSRRADGRGAGRSGARVLRRRRARSLSDGRAGASVDRRDQAIPGFSERAPSPSRRIAPASMRSGRSTSSAASARRCARRRRTPRASRPTVDDVRVSVAAEVARNYFEVRGLQQQLAVAERSLINQRETLRLTQVRRDAGFGEEQDVASAGGACRGDRGEHPADPERASRSASIASRC